LVYRENEYGIKSGYAVFSLGLKKPQRALRALRKRKRE
jgi:hypothetical protein